MSGSDSIDWGLVVAELRRLRDQSQDLVALDEAIAREVAALFASHQLLESELRAANDTVEDDQRERDTGDETPESDLPDDHAETRRRLRKTSVPAVEVVLGDLLRGRQGSARHQGRRLSELLPRGR